MKYACVKYLNGQTPEELTETVINTPELITSGTIDYEIMENETTLKKGEIENLLSIDEIINEIINLISTFNSYFKDLSNIEPRIIIGYSFHFLLPSGDNDIEDVEIGFDDSLSLKKNTAQATKEQIEELIKYHLCKVIKYSIGE